MEKEIDRDLQRKKKYSENERPIIDMNLDREIMEINKYRDLIELRPPKEEVVPKRKLVI